MRAQQRLGEVILSVKEGTLRPGDAVAFSLRCQPRAEVVFKKVTATLSGQEVATSGHGTNRTTRRHSLGEQPLTLWENRRVARAEAVLLEGSLTLPADASPSFAASDNAIRWDLKMVLDVESWPDWEDTIELMVLRG